MKKRLLILASVLFFVAKISWGACTIDTSNVYTTPMPLQLAAISAGADTPDGTVLYKQTYNLDFTSGNQAITVTCPENAAQMGYYSFSTTPLPLSSWSSGIEAGKVYESGVPGVGVWVHQGTTGDAAIPTMKSLSTDQCSTSGGKTSCIVFGGYKRWDVYFIKTGVIQPGTISGSNLPCVQVNYNDTENSSINTVGNVCMTGAINVIASTCKTPDVTVQMGSHPVTDLTGVNSTTGWVDASIKLTDCPVFYGYGSSGNWYTDNTGTNGSGTPINNKLELKLTPNTSVIDSGNGVFAITSGTNSATGVGIQLAYGSGASPSMVNFGGTNSYEMTNGSSGNVTLPLVARYIQTDTNVLPGLANSAVTFLINYY